MKKLYSLLSVVLASFLFCGTTMADNGDKLPADVYFDKGKLTFKSRNGAFKLWFDNRIYLDAAVYVPSDDVSGLDSKPNKDLEYDDGDFRFNSGVIVRRARFAVKGTLYDKPRSKHS